MTKTMADKLDFYQEKRCRACGRLLFKGLVISAEVKCSKCNEYNYFFDNKALEVKDIKAVQPFLKDVRIEVMN